MPLGGRRCRPAEPRGTCRRSGGRRAVGEVVREAHEVRAADHREDAGPGEGVPGDSPRDRPGALDRGQRGGEARVRDLAARPPRRARARRGGTGGRVSASGLLAEVLQRLQPPQGLQPHEEPPRVLWRQDGAEGRRWGAQGEWVGHRRDRALRGVQARRDTRGPAAGLSPEQIAAASPDLGLSVSTVYHWVARGTPG